MVPLAAADARPLAGSLSFSSRGPTRGGPTGRAGLKRPRAAAAAAAAAAAGKKVAGKKATSGPLSFAFGEDDE